ncbi:MAG: hypothetical protein AB7O52_20005 [Planctomycetota bacterium]
MRTSVVFANIGRVVLGLLLLACGSSLRAATTVVDLAALVPGTDPLVRVLAPNNDNGGAFSLGPLGVPVAAGADLDGDGFRDYAIAHMRASPLGRDQAGTVSLVFGNGTIGETLDLQAGSPRILRIFGAANEGEREFAGSEIWMDDVTGDGLGDLLICRQNLSLPGRTGAGALTVLVGGATLRGLAMSSTPIDLASPPPGVVLTTLIGPTAFARLGIWTRTGDVDGDGTLDFIVAADQEATTGTHGGATYVVRGGAHLAVNQTIDLANFAATPLAGHVARITPPSGANHFHFGATCQVGDLNGNGRAEVMVAAAFNRAGGIIGPFASSHGSGGAPGGRVYVVWDDAFPVAPWPVSFQIDLEAPAPGTLTTINSGSLNVSLGEEILGGLDYSGDGFADLFIGDLVADGTGGSRPTSGIGYVLYHAALAKGLTFSIDNPPPAIAVTTIWGPFQGAIGSDTAGHGDFNGDGIADLMIGNPKASPQGREGAGTMTVLLGQSTPWPALIDTAPGVPNVGVEIIDIHGVRGDMPGDGGDVLCYSAAVGDIDADGRVDLIVNEMKGNGTSPSSIDNGNLLVISGLLFGGAVGSGFIRGDVNQDAMVDISDPIQALAYLFGSGNTACLEALDVNDDGAVDISDPVYELAYQFSGGTPPSAPFPGCGDDPTFDALDCFGFAACP